MAMLPISSDWCTPTRRKFPNIKQSENPNCARVKCHAQKSNKCCLRKWNQMNAVQESDSLYEKKKKKKEIKEDREKTNKNTLKLKVFFSWHWFIRIHQQIFFSPCCPVIVGWFAQKAGCSRLHCQHAYKVFDFAALPESTFSADSLTVSAHPQVQIACIYICTHVKDPVVHVRVRWIRETLKDPACSVGWVARLCRSRLSQGKATRISHGRNPIGTVQFVAL